MGSRAVVAGSVPPHRCNDRVSGLWERFCPLKPGPRRVHLHVYLTKSCINVTEKHLAVSSSRHLARLCFLWQQGIYSPPPPPHPLAQLPFGRLPVLLDM